MTTVLWSVRASIAGALSALAEPGATPATPTPVPAATTPDPQTKVQEVLHLMTQYATQYGMRVVGALFFLVASWIVSKYLVRITVRGLTKAHVDITLAKFLSNLARWGLLALVIVACLDIFGVPATSFVTVLGTVGLAIGLALQGSLSHLAAGVMLMLFRPFRVGDGVVVAGQRGVVDEIELFTTRLDTPDKRRVIIPNGQIFGAIIENLTHHPDRRVDANVGVAYSADIDHTRQVLVEAAKSVPGRIADRPPEVNMVQLGASSVDWTVVVWTTAADAAPAKQALLKKIKEGLDLAGIDIPFPQMVVHSGPAAAAAAPVSSNRAVVRT